MAEWQPASQVSGLAGVFGSQTPSADASIPPESQPPRAADISSVYDAPSQAQDPIDMLANSTAQPGVTTKRRPSVPHRGGTILDPGILGLVCCGICGICAWVMGSGDMKQINAGVMDPSGKGVTQAGKILGIIGTILWILGVVIRVGVLAATS
ncbi:MAG: hypothetical protein GVY16_09150 [Planctomycetes bacterium]|jgi:hypothetical protein|nr:hypothetical protein [Planctomycetota bacterium]